MSEARTALNERMTLWLHKRLVSALDALQPYRERAHFEREIWDTTSNLHAVLSSLGEYNTRSKNYNASLPTATLEQIGTAVDEVSSGTGVIGPTV